MKFKKLKLQLLNFQYKTEYNVHYQPNPRKNQSCLYSYRNNGKRLSDGSVEYGPVSLYCYPSDAAVESMGSPFTRLVIEGKSAGRICHYEFAINRGEDCGGEDNAGISRNCRYVYEIMLTRPSQ